MDVQQLYIRNHEEISDTLGKIGFKYSISDCEQIIKISKSQNDFVIYLSYTCCYNPPGFCNFPSTPFQNSTIYLKPTTRH